MSWQIAVSLLCYAAAGVWMYRTTREFERLRSLLAARERIAFREELLEAAKRFASDPPTATVLSELADGLLTIDEIYDQWEEQTTGSHK